VFRSSDRVDSWDRIGTFSPVGAGISGTDPSAICATSPVESEAFLLKIKPDGSGFEYANWSRWMPPARHSWPDSRPRRTCRCAIRWARRSTYSATVLRRASIRAGN
jgi:hypothetical protein